MDRAEAIKRCDRYNEEWANARAKDVEPFIAYNQSLDDLFYMAGKALREQEQSKWISVKDDLPKKEGSYIVATKNGGVMITHFYTKSKSFSGTRLNRLITHWMERPKPPEGGAEE